MTILAKHRHSVTGGYTRGEETRARIIAAAMRLFGEKGYEAASTRDIAAAAGVNAPALQYYFDKKEGVLPPQGVAAARLGRDRCAAPGARQLRGARSHA
jgi:AcrR family transcriptional regulator